MTVSINGTTGISGVDGSASTPALQGSDTNTGISFGTDEVAINTGGTARATVDSSGRLLVGTATAPTAGNSQYAKIAIQGNTAFATGGSVLSMQRGTSATSITGGQSLGEIEFADNDGNPFARITGLSDATAGSGDYPGRIVLATTADGASSPTERMRINAAGSILINTNSGSPGTASVTGQAAIAFNPSTNGGLVIASNSGAGTLQQFTNTAFGVVGSITTNGTSTAFNTSSDYRLKENVTAVTDGITRLQQLKPSRFNFIADPTKTVDGFLAHEVQTIVPEAITGEKDAVDSDGNPEYQGIDQSKLVPLLTAALQEAITRIETLEAEVQALKGGN